MIPSRRGSSSPTAGTIRSGGVSIFGNGIHAYDPTTNVFTVLKLNNWYALYNSSGGYTTTPLPANSTDPTPVDHHPLATLEVVPELNALFTVNGVNSISLSDPSLLTKTWRFDLTGHSWTLVSAAGDANYPPNNVGSPSGLVYDPTTKKLVYFVVNSCGCSGTTTYLFDPFQNAWTVLPQDPSSLGVYLGGSGFAYDSKRGLIIAYGGNVNITVAATPYLWAYSVAQNKWTRLSDAPIAAMAPGFAYDSTHDLYVAVVGNDTYFYNPVTTAWTKLPTTLSRPAGTPQNWQALTYNPARDLFLFEGGNWQFPYMAILRIDPSAIVADTTPPTVSMTAPAANATVSGTTPVSASAADNGWVSSVQFQVDGTNLGSAVTTAPYSVSWNTTTVANGTHTLKAIATDGAGNSATANVAVSVNNPIVAPVISGVSAGTITATSAVIAWTTDQAADSQVAYGTTASYGSSTAVAAAMVTAHSVTLTGLSGSTTYHYQVLSKNAQGVLASSGDFTFTTSAAPVTLLQIQGTTEEAGGAANGSVVTPTVAPVGFTGTVIDNGAGSVNFTPGGVYFLNCCGNTANAYYKFTGPTIGSIFNVNQGQISFSLTSRYSYAQRQASATGQRFAFDVRDGAGNHLFYFRTQISSGLQFSYSVNGGAQFYWAPAGTEDALFGNGVKMDVLITWNGSTSSLYLNGRLVQSAGYTKPTPSWTAASIFDLGAYEYANAGGYNVLDDIIGGFIVAGPAIVADTTPPTVSMTAPAANATVSGTTPVSASAADNGWVSSVQFQVDGTNLGSAVTTAPYSVSWNTTTVANGTHTLKAIATDGAGNSATANVAVSVNNPIVAPVISGVSAGTITATSAVIAWTTDQAADSQVAYGTTASYGSSTAVAAAMVTAHSVTLTGLSGSTTYHYQVLSKNAQGVLASSGDFTFTTPAAPVTLLQIQGTTEEAGGAANGSVVTPTVAPVGFTGTVIDNGAGSVNFTPGGVYFLNCCGNTANAYYKFTGPTIGSIFNVNQGQISFSLTSRYSYAQRQASATGQRFAFDVRDGAGNHLFYFRTQISSGLQFSYSVNGGAQFYWAPAGTEDALFGNGVKMDVLITWNGSTSSLYLNGRLVQSGGYTKPTPSWTAASIFDLGAYEYANAGGYNVLDDIIGGFTVAGPGRSRWLISPSSLQREIARSRSAKRLTASWRNPNRYGRLSSIDDGSTDETILRLAPVWRPHTALSTATGRAAARNRGMCAPPEESGSPFWTTMTFGSRTRSNVKWQ